MKETNHKKVGRWTPESHKARFQRIVQNSRFLLLPWVEVKGLASSVLILVTQQLPDAWDRAFHQRRESMDLRLVPNRKSRCTNAYKKTRWDE
ncbi:Druantia anti-phage system protein DruA [Sulfidibacter corallicola]|uniref:DUF4338 domain-containing protein n=1 Tax=Sulfidibacter corallicola TaxID=2818388 RepID=A0A8A4TWG0_SULCO|nr:DUF4338 domain-containing protein [Sulfidibacter corallicola]